jgi:hypothetical protein
MSDLHSAAEALAQRLRPRLARAVLDPTAMVALNPSDRLLLYLYGVQTHNRLTNLGLAVRDVLREQDKRSA